MGAKISKGWGTGQPAWRQKDIMPMVRPLQWGCGMKRLSSRCKTEGWQLNSSASAVLQSFGIFKVRPFLLGRHEYQNTLMGDERTCSHSSRHSSSISTSQALLPLSSKLIFPPTPAGPFPAGAFLCTYDWCILTGLQLDIMRIAWTGQTP